MASKEKMEQLAVRKRKITIQWAYKFSSHDEWKMATSTKEEFQISRLLVTSKQCRQTLLILKLFQASVGLLMGQLLIFSVLQGSVSRKPRKLFGPVKPYWAKSRTLYTNTELFYSHILNLNRSPLIQEVSGAYTSPFLDTDELKMTWRDRKVSGTFEKRAGGLVTDHNWVSN